MSRFLISAILAIASLLFSGLALSQAESGAEQLRQFVRNSKTAEGDFVQQQLRAQYQDLFKKVHVCAWVGGRRAYVCYGLQSYASM